MKKLILFAAASLMLAIPALASEAAFDRTLSVKGQATLFINTGAGHIHLTRGSDGQLLIHARVKSNGWGNQDAKVKEIAEHPPIEQTGDIIRVGVHNEHWNNISIDYDVQVPQNTILSAGTGSGDIDIDGVGESASLGTGSGRITGHGLHGSLKAGAGSGDIDVELTGNGDVSVDTGSGSVSIRGVQGGLKASTGSGRVNITGTPLRNWKIDTGSGSVEIETGSAAYDLYADCGSGGVNVEQKLTSVKKQERDHVEGKVNGGGPLVHVDTGSGNIHVY